MKETAEFRKEKQGLAQVGLQRERVTFTDEASKEEADCSHSFYLS